MLVARYYPNRAAVKKGLSGPLPLNPGEPLGDNLVRLSWSETGRVLACGLGCARLPI
jgi:hypothetical protein